ncbi:ras-related protein Rab-17 isoform X4 [Macaca thibetana thibetana]|uniref:ras-related protein Rab-17 isoform X4 n=1 Tax=Macaca thibetana thibetana TaxID=257877 RepID=UPI0003ABA97E|nr:PREDICTED: ras-related protein Rab-17 isoform X2 [Macaca fascicularis]XP_050607636.1 ras-related protein Rab-17 isoform X4 [Macaca thibetana thibetana]
MAQAHRTPQPRAAPSQPRAFKLVLLGSGSVGAFFTKVVDVGTASLKLEIWDTAGQEKYHSVCHLYFRGANAALLVYDITRKDSFLKAQQWLKDLEKELHPEEVLVMLVGNKTDLSEEREVTFQEGKEFAESQKLLFMETSAKLNYQVSEVFSAVAQELLQRDDREGQALQADAAVALNEGPARQAKCCAH